MGWMRCVWALIEDSWWYHFDSHNLQVVGSDWPVDEQLQGLQNYADKMRLRSRLYGNIINIYGATTGVFGLFVARRHYDLRAKATEKQIRAIEKGGAK